jgi:GT2 family glycosyltransferase
MRDAKDPLVSIGIITWNSEGDLPACLEGLAAQDDPALEMIAVDNGSGDGTVDLIRKRLPGANLLTNQANEGYCRAHNQAIARSQGEFYLGLNPDVRLLPGYIERMVRALQSRPEYGSAVGKLWQTTDHDPRLLDSTGLFLDRRRHQYLRGHGRPDLGQYDQAEEIFGVDGAVAFHRRKMLEDVAFEGQYFDEQFFTYMEDVDLAWRARLLGWKSWYEPAAQAFHERKFKPGRRGHIEREIRRVSVKNRYLVILKNEGAEEWRRDWWRVRLYDLAIWGYILLLERSSLGAIGLFNKQKARALAWRSEIWRRVRAQADQRLKWFDGGE